MPDVVVTVPKGMWAKWLAEGELPGQERWPCIFCSAPGECEICHGKGELTPGDTTWHFYLGGHPPTDVVAGDRVYIVAHGRLRGYAPLIDLEHPCWRGPGRPSGFAFVRGGDAEALTIPEPIRGFQGWRYRWWDRSAETPFPDWQEAGVA